MGWNLKSEYILKHSENEIRTKELERKYKVVNKIRNNREQLTEQSIQSLQPLSWKMQQIWYICIMKCIRLYRACYWRIWDSHTNVWLSPSYDKVYQPYLPISFQAILNTHNQRRWFWTLINNYWQLLELCLTKECMKWVISKFKLNYRSIQFTINVSLRKCTVFNYSYMYHSTLKSSMQQDAEICTLYRTYTSY